MKFYCRRPAFSSVGGSCLACSWMASFPMITAKLTEWLEIKRLVRKDYPTKCRYFRFSARKQKMKKIYHSSKTVHEASVENVELSVFPSVTLQGKAIINYIV
ncbi:hypothetical protein ACWN8V_12690 [Vagococcus elongatus]